MTVVVGSSEDGPDEQLVDETKVVDTSAAYLLARIGILEARVRQVVARNRATDPNPDDPFRGLYITDVQVDSMLDAGTVSRTFAWGDADILAQLDEQAAELEKDGTEIRLRSLARRAGLDEQEVDLLLVAMAPDLDRRFERLYGYLNDDVSRRRATVALAIELAGASTWSAQTRSRLAPDGPLVSSGLVLVEEADRPTLSRSLRVPDRVTAHLLGDDQPDSSLAHALTQPAPWPDKESSEDLGRIVREGVELIYLKESGGGSAAALAARSLQVAGLGAVVVDLRRLAPADEPVEVLRMARREALLIGAGLVAGPFDAIAERAGLTVAGFTGGPSHGRVPVFLHGRSTWEPSWSPRVPLVAEVAPHTAQQRAELWHASLGDLSLSPLSGSDVADQFVFSSDEVARAVESAWLQSRLDGAPIGSDHLRLGARAQNGAGLERLARRIQPDVSWSDLVLANATKEALVELAARARRRGRVLDEWGMRPGGGRGRGITALFAGDSGTGKTMSAEVVAGDLGLDLYTVNLATVVDKYVGETEKNLERIFTEADGVSAVLLFDEADAIFGKRSEVKDANDRYANIEVAYLLQRMETFGGIALLSTNLRANVDDAFSRRLDLIVDFPLPDVELRRLLWDRCLAPGVPRGADLDLDFCANAFELSGGNIRSIAVTAAYRAADRDEPVAMADMIWAIGQEYRKLGRLIVPSEFGRYVHLVSGNS